MQCSREGALRYGIAAALLAVLGSPIAGQWLNHPDPTTPRTKDGQPNLSARAPRPANGRPDLSGVWAAAPSDDVTRRRDDGDPLVADLQFISRYALNLLADVKPEDEPIRPEAAALLRQRMASFGKDS